MNSGRRSKVDNVMTGLFTCFTADVQQSLFYGQPIYSNQYTYLCNI